MTDKASLPATEVRRLDPELADAFAAIPKAPNGKLVDFTDIPAMRASMTAAEEYLAANIPPDPHVTFGSVQAPRSDGSTVGIRTARPTDASGELPVLLWFHGGGQVVASAFGDDAWIGALALAADIVVGAVEYRLAPETRAPGQGEDGFTAYSYFLEHAADLGIDPRRVGLGGASGGGAPAAVTALMARDRGLPTPRLLSLLYPMFDDRLETQSAREFTDVGVSDRREFELVWDAVLGEGRRGTPDVDVYSAPGRVENVSGMPSTFIACGYYDVPRDESIEFAVRLIRAHVPVDLHIYDGAYHSWDRVAPEAALTKSLQHTWHTYLKQQFSS